MLLVNLFLAFFRIGLFAVGGAYSFLPLIEREVVQRYQWLTKAEFLDIAGITKIFPGAISIKYATYTGYKLAGIPGAVSANLGNILPPVMFIIFASVFYMRCKGSPAFQGAFEGVRMATLAMIIAVAFQVVDVQSILNARNVLIILLSFVVFIYTSVHPAAIIILAAGVGAVWR